MNKTFATIEQSKKLIELNVSIDTADMYYSFDYNIKEYDEDAQVIPQSELKQHFSLFPEDIPAWSLSALLVLFDDKAGLAEEYKSWFAYDNGKSHCTKHHNNPLDAVFEMICLLKENDKI